MAVVNYSIAETIVVALAGLGIIFAAMIVLILLMKGLTSASVAIGRRTKAEATVTGLPAAEPQPINMIPAEGSLGEIDLYGVDDLTAALIMAIVADEMQTPLNQLRFLSIRERETGKEVV